MSVLVLGSPEDLELAGLAGAPAEQPELAVALRDPSLLDGVQAPRRLAWLVGAARPGPGDCAVAAQSGEGLWRRAAWPAADALFDLDPPAPGAGYLVAGGSGERRQGIAGQLAARGHQGAASHRLTPSGLRNAGVVALLSQSPGGPLPAEAPAVAAARRVLVTDGWAPAFGLQPALDFLPARDDAAVVEAVDAVLTRPEAFAALRALAGHAARAHRASEVYERLLADVRALGG